MTTGPLILTTHLILNVFTEILIWCSCNLVFIFQIYLVNLIKFSIISKEYLLLLLVIIIPGGCFMLILDIMGGRKILGSRYSNDVSEISY